jgi:hypothetical protein
VRWQQHINGVILGAASVLGETVYVAGLGPNVGTFGFNVKTGKKVFESDLGEYSPVVSDGHRMYLVSASGIRAFEHESAKEQRNAAHRRQEKRHRQQNAHREKRKRQESAHKAKHQRQQKAHQAKHHKGG